MGGRSRLWWMLLVVIGLLAGVALPGLALGKVCSCVPSISLSPPSAENPVGSDHTVTARVLLNHKAAAQQRVHFDVTGANSASGEEVTDANGEAQFTYTGEVAGTDQIKACVDINHNCVCDETEATAGAMKEFVEQPEGEIQRRFTVFGPQAPLEIQGEQRKSCPPGEARLLRSKSLLRVRGKNIKQVTYYDDGKRLKTVTRPPFSINENRLSPGVNRIRARVVFEGCARPRSLATTVSRGQVEALRPPFTG
jgi:hypothetical protein